MSGLSTSRVFELAKELGIKPEELLKTLLDLGVKAEGPNSILDEETAEMVRELLASKPSDEGSRTVTIPSIISVRDFAELIGMEPAEVQKSLLEIGVFASLTQNVTLEQAQKVGEKYGLTIRQGNVKFETKSKTSSAKKQKKGAWIRPPVVTVLGHVDHGKTSLLDAIRNTKVTEGEFGGITQHIGAYQVICRDKPITFIDTPGHQAFTAMRARGAQVTDIAVLVVAADDGIMPQTREAIDHARAAEVPIIVALNKIDKPEANPDFVKQQLAEAELIPEEWGGDTMVIPVSAIQRTGIDDLLEGILLQAEIMELTADPSADATGVVVESRQERGRGAIATVLVQNGTLKRGAPVVVGSTYGKIRQMIDDKGEVIQKAGPSTPVEIIGLQEPPSAGDTLEVMPDEKTARQTAEARQSKLREDGWAVSGAATRSSLEDLYRQLQAGETKELTLILRADVDGTAEAIRDSLSKLSTDEVSVRVIQSLVGNVSESDVMLAAASKAIVIGFNVSKDKEAVAAAEREGIEIRLYNIIYELLDDVRLAMSGLLEPEKREEVTGHAEVRQTFRTPAGIIAGSYVQDGRIPRNAFVRVIRGGETVFDGKIDSLRRFKEDVREVQSGFECGIQVEGFNDVQEGDIIEAYVIEEVARAL